MVHTKDEEMETEIERGNSLASQKERTGFPNFSGVWALSIAEPHTFSTQPRETGVLYQAASLRTEFVTSICSPATQTVLM